MKWIKDLIPSKLRKFIKPAFFTLAVVTSLIVVTVAGSSVLKTETAFGYGYGGGGGGGGGGGFPPPPTTLAPVVTTPAPTTTAPTPGAVDVHDVVTSTGTFTQNVIATSNDNKIELNIQKGVVGTVGQGGPPITKLTIVPVDTKTAPPPPVQPNFTGTFVGIPYDFGPDGAVFDKPITITFNYVVPSGFNLNDLVIAFYDVSKGVWVELTDISVDPATGTISGKTTHFTKFAVIAKAAAAPTAVPTQTTQPTPTVAPKPTQPTTTTSPPTQPVVTQPTVTTVVPITPAAITPAAPVATTIGINWTLIGSLLGAVVLIAIFLTLYLRYRHD